MRGLLIVAIVLYFLPQAFRRPHIGLLLMCWFGYMNPHRLSWGFTYDFPFFYAITLTTLLCTLLAFGRKGVVDKPPANAITITLVIFVGWLLITTLNAEFFDRAWPALIKFIKIQVGIWLTLMLINSKQKLLTLVAVVALSIGFFGVKGGVFSLVTGGNFRVWGPPGSFIEGNNELALALLMVLPFIYFLFTLSPQRWLRWGLGAAALLILASVIFSYSRGAFLAMGVTLVVLWFSSRHKLMLGIAALVVGLAALPLIPEAWWQRMSTIKTYQEDESAMGRLNAWSMAFNVASDRLTGGGFDMWGRDMTQLYAPDPDDPHDAHSIYFETMGEHGFIGMSLFLLFFFLVWLEAGRVRRRCAKDPQLKWAANLMAMCRVSLMAYASGGAFLGLAFFDLPYHIATFVLITSRLVTETAAEGRTAQSRTIRETLNTSGARRPAAPGQRIASTRG